MTWWRVERTPRTAIPASCAASSGVSALMPPHSQGAERRWSLRVLVVGGLAGAAWLLTGAAAHAADRDVTPDGSLLGSSLIGSIVDGDLAQPAVSPVLHAVARPQGTDRAAHQHHSSASVLDVPTRILSRPVATLTAPLQADDDGDTALSGVTNVVRDLTGPLRPTGGPVKSPAHAQFTQPVKAARPVAPVKSRPDPLVKARPVAPVRSRPVADRTPVVSNGVAHPEPVPSVAPAPAVAHRSGTIRRLHADVRHRHSAAAEAAEPVTASNGDTSPGGNGPAPLPVQIGAVSGISTGGSGSPTEGGSAAFLPAGVAAGTMAFHRLPHATDVEARRFDVEAPTVSPD